MKYIVNIIYLVIIDKNKNKLIKNQFDFLKYIKY